MSRPRIRPARQSELATLRALEIEAGQLFHTVGMTEVANHLPDLDRLRRSQEQGLVWVAERESEIAGYIVASELDGNAHIEQVSVAPTHARQGIGRALVTRVEDWGRARQRPATTLTTFTDVPWNGPYYERLGYRKLSADRLGPELLATMTFEASMPGIDASRRCAMTKPNERDADSEGV